MLLSLRRISIASVFLFGLAGLLVSQAVSADSYGDALAAYQSEDFREAFRLFGLAGDAGDGRALYYLGRMYERGEGVAHDTVRAHAFFNQSAASSHSLASRAREARSRVEDQLTPEQLERAQRIARGESAEEPELPPISAQDRRFCDQLFSVAQRLARGDKPGVSNPPQKLRRSYLGTDYLSFGSRKAHTYASYDPEDSDYRLRFRLEMPDARALADLMLTCTAQSHPGWSVENYRRSFYWTAENGRQINVRWDTEADREFLQGRWIKGIEITVRIEEASGS